MFWPKQSGRVGLGLMSSETSALWTRRWFLLALLAAIALTSHVAFILGSPVWRQANRNPDYTNFYEPVARQLAAGRGIYMPSGAPAIKYPPGIPMAYGATFWLADRTGLSHETGVVALQGLLAILSGVLVAALALQCYGPRVALLACFLWSTYPFHLWLTKALSGETQAIVLLLSSVLAFARWLATGRASLRWGCVCGAVLGLTALTKPFTIALPAVFVGLAWICDVPCNRKKRVVFSFAVLVGFALTISPWEVWAWRTSGQRIPLCTNGRASLADGLTFGGLREKGRSTPHLPPRVAMLVDDLANHREELKSYRGIARLLLAKTREEPMTVSCLFVIKAVQSWYSNDSHTHEKWAALIQLLYIPLFVFGAGLARLGNRQEKNFFLIAVGVTLYYWAMATFIAVAIVRYIVPPISLLMVLAGGAAGRIQPDLVHGLCQRSRAARHAQHHGDVQEQPQF